MHERYLIVNADDFGLTPGVSRGIAEAMEAGVVTSASVMVNMPAWDDAVARLPALATRASFGLHLNLVTGRPLTRATSLVDASTGEFVSLRQFAWRAVTGRLRDDDIARECEAQLARLRDVGIPVAHADSHRHVHMLSPVWRAIAPVLQDLRVRRPIEALPFSLRAPRARVKSCLLRASSLAHGSVPGAGTVRFIGLSLQGSPHFARELRRAIEQLPAGTTELMVHPGFADEVLSSIDSYTRARERELRVLTSMAFRAWLDASAVQMTSFSDDRVLARSAGQSIQ